MADYGAFASAGSTGAALLGAAETSLTVPTTTSTIYTAGSKGSKIEEVRLWATATTVAGLVYLFRYDGTSYWLHDVIPVSAVTASTTVAPWTPGPIRYNNLFLKSGGSLRASQSIAGNASLIVAQAYGGDF